MKPRLQALTRAAMAAAKGSLKPLVTSALSVAAAFYLATHLKPSLTVSLASGEVITAESRKEPTKVLTALVDRSAEDDRKVIAMNRITFKSTNDFTRRHDQGVTVVTKFILHNDGWATARHVVIGIGIPGNSEGSTILASPNVTVFSDKLVQTSGAYPPYRRVEIERLGISETAILTALANCSCGGTKDRPGNGSELFIKTDEDRGYSPVLFLSSDEGTGETLDMMNMKDAFALEKALFPGSASGYWASGIDLRKGAAAPTIEPARGATLSLTVTGKDGKEHEVSLTAPD
jgi:hypothetical protein